MLRKTSKIIYNALPAILMIALIPLVADDYWLSLIDILIIVVALSIYREKDDIPVLVFGFFIMIAAEYFFISTGVERFLRQSLLGVMPLWLPILWAYAFVAIKRSVVILSR